MKNPYLFFLLVFVIFSSSLYAQEVQKISLTRTPTNGPFKGGDFPASLIQDISGYKIPKIYTNYILKKFNVFRGTESSYFKLSGKFKERNYLSVLININIDSSRTVLIDTNNDDDFNNEKALTFPKLKPQVQSAEYIPVNLLHISTNTLIQTYIRPITYQANFYYNNPKEKEFYLLINSFSNLEGKIKINEMQVSLFVEDYRLSPFVSLKDSKIALKQDSNKYLIYDSQEIININDIKILVDSVSNNGSELLVRVYKKGAEFNEKGFYEGFDLKNISTVDIDQKQLQIPLAGSYTLLDFWGTWCGPCKELTPNLLAIHKKFQDKVKLVSLAGSSKEEDVRSYILEHHMDWTHIVENKETAILFNYKMFNVFAYPTFILVDPKGKIVFRGTGETALNKINSYLKDTL
jgi:thiol-disulfide isomerase/thioredoxin